MYESDGIHTSLSESIIRWSVSSQYLLTIRGFLEDSDRQYVLTEWCPSGTLGEVLTINCPKHRFPETVAQRFTGELAHAIDALGPMAALLGGLDPDDILVAKDGHLRINVTSLFVRKNRGGVGRAIQLTEALAFQGEGSDALLSTRGQIGSRAHGLSLFCGVSPPFVPVLLRPGFSPVYDDMQPDFPSLTSPLPSEALPRLAWSLAAIHWFMMTGCPPPASPSSGRRMIGRAALLAAYPDRQDPLTGPSLRLLTAGLCDQSVPRRVTSMADFVAGVGLQFQDSLGDSTPLSPFALRSFAARVPQPLDLSAETLELCSYTRPDNYDHGIDTPPAFQDPFLTLRYSRTDDFTGLNHDQQRPTFDSLMESLPVLRILLNAARCALARTGFLEEEGTGRRTRTLSIASPTQHEEQDRALELLQAFGTTTPLYRQTEQRCNAEPDSDPDGYFGAGPELGPADLLTPRPYECLVQLPLWLQCHPAFYEALINTQEILAVRQWSAASVSAPPLPSKRLLLAVRAVIAFGRMILKELALIAQRGLPQADADAVAALFAARSDLFVVRMAQQASESSLAGVDWASLRPPQTQTDTSLRLRFYSAEHQTTLLCQDMASLSLHGVTALGVRYERLRRGTSPDPALLRDLLQAYGRLITAYHADLLSTVTRPTERLRYVASVVDTSARYLDAKGVQSAILRHYLRAAAICQSWAMAAGSEAEDPLTPAVLAKLVGIYQKLVLPLQAQPQAAILERTLFNQEATNDPRHTSGLRFLAESLINEADKQSDESHQHDVTRLLRFQLILDAMTAGADSTASLQRLSGMRDKLYLPNMLVTLVCYECRDLTAERVLTPADGVFTVPARRRFSLRLGITSTVAAPLTLERLTLQFGSDAHTYTLHVADSVTIEPRRELLLTAEAQAPDVPVEYRAARCHAAMGLMALRIAVQQPDASRCPGLAFTETECALDMRCEYAGLTIDRGAAELFCPLFVNTSGQCLLLHIAAGVDPSPAQTVSCVVGGVTLSLASDSARLAITDAGYSLQLPPLAPHSALELPLEVSSSLTPGQPAFVRFQCGPSELVVSLIALQSLQCDVQSVLGGNLLIRCRCPGLPSNVALRVTSLEVDGEPVAQDLRGPFLTSSSSSLEVTHHTTSRDTLTVTASLALYQTPEQNWADCGLRFARHRKQQSSLATSESADQIELHSDESRGLLRMQPVPHMEQLFCRLVIPAPADTEKQLEWSVEIGQPQLVKRGGSLLAPSLYRIPLVVRRLSQLASPILLRLTRPLDQCPLRPIGKQSWWVGGPEASIEAQFTLSDASIEAPQAPLFSAFDCPDDRNDTLATRPAKVQWVRL